MLTVTVNGESRRTAAATVADLVRELGLQPEKVAVERNGEIAPRSQLAQVALMDGDVLEIVHFVGGGDHSNPLPLREREEARRAGGRGGRRREPPLRAGPLSQPSPSRGEGL